MATTSVSAGAQAGGTGRNPVAEQVKSKGVLVWAVIGVFFIALMTYIFASWLLTTEGPVPTGVTPLPGWMKFAVRANEVVMGAGIIWLFWLFVVKPKRETGRFTLDSLLFFGFFFCWWQDPLFNYVAQGFTYNSYFINLGGWAPHIPGWNSPNAQYMPEPIIWDLSFYLFITLGWVIVMSNMMRKVRNLRPSWGTWRLIVGCFVVTFIADVIIEMFWTRTGMYIYPGGMDWWSVFDDKYYKFPFSESIGAGVVYTAWASFRYFVNDKGQTIAERGIENVNASPGRKTFLRFLAVTGALNIIFLICYSFFIQLWQIHPGEYPKDAQERSYFMGGVCGTGTDYACPSPNVSIPRGDGSVHIGPDGTVRVPEGTKLPASPPYKTTP
jgi:hypothetical protein